MLTIALLAWAIALTLTAVIGTCYVQYIAFTHGVEYDDIDVILSEER